MKAFAALLDRLAYEPARNAKLRLLADYFRTTPDPDRGYALAALTSALSFRYAKPGLIRALIAERTDPTLFALSYDYVGDLSETVALMWPVRDSGKPPPPGGGRSARVSGPGGDDSSSAHAARPHHPTPDDLRSSAPPLPGEGVSDRGPSLSDVVTRLSSLGKSELPAQLAQWLDELDETGRWALLKLVTGAPRIGVSARLAKTAVATLGNKEPDEIELLWPNLKPPYAELFAWLEARGARPQSHNPAPFRPVMLAHAIEEEDFAVLDPAAYLAEWKWDGIRVQAAAGRDAGDPGGRRVCRLYSRTGEDISAAFPDIVEALAF